MANHLPFPTIYLLPTHFDVKTNELREVEGHIPTLTRNINAATIILGKVAKKPRALLELRSRNLITHEVTFDSTQTPSSEYVSVVRLPWLIDSLAQGKVLPLQDYLVYHGRKSPPPIDSSDILKRAREDGQTAQPSHHKHTHHKRPRLMPESTSDHNEAADLPDIPEFLHTPYSCQRPTLLNPPNSAFIEQLKKMRTIRTLESDEVGVRAYSSSIASVAAYPYRISSAAEVGKLPGCGPKIMELYKQWSSNGYLNDVNEAAEDPKMKVLLLFYDIWGVAAKTAHEFYDRGWRDLDDIVEQGWDSITRVQQIGVKYYDELQEKIPRAEVEGIANIILSHANNIEDGFQMAIVGGFRRGKSTSGDVDVVLSHPDPKATAFFINAIVQSLEKDCHITHVLTMSTKNSERGQKPTLWKGEDHKKGGFDTLDKALVVWQDPVRDSAASERNSNPHRRVDIIISPWRTVGCAVVGWTGAMTFERDLRRYCKQEKHLKFDSSGIRWREEKGGEWLDVESDADGKLAPDILTAERRVFERLGLEWRPPEERCTE
ncbi:hypothetical protein F5Y16DRAFT_220366 [Xylariaceae sp. FL0255]|nr:hypothetical protein F5Y16DRAFT_220366 [Xylariaceae sp. FL0255]